MNADKLLFRCSSLGYLMTDGRGGGGLTEKQAEALTTFLKKSNLTDKQREYRDDLIAKRDAPPEIGDTVKTHLIDVFISAKYGRREEIQNKVLTKGNEREEDSITLVSLKLNRFFKKNQERKSNSFITGSWDLDIRDMETGNMHTQTPRIVETLDTKSSWSMHTFFRSQYKKLDPLYDWQGQGYMALTGANKHTVAYCLVNGTHKAMMDERRIAGYDFIDPDNSPAYKEKCKQIEINHIFDRAAFKAEYPDFEFAFKDDEWNRDVPAHERIFTFEFIKDEKKILALYERIKLCRQWMNENLFSNGKG